MVQPAKRLHARGAGSIFEISSKQKPYVARRCDVLHGFVGVGQGPCTMDTQRAGLGPADPFSARDPGSYQLGEYRDRINCILCGGGPLIVYNVENHYPTLRSNAHFSTAEFYQKLQVLKTTADGSAWLGYLVNEPGTQNSRVPETRIEQWSAALHDHVGEHRRDYLLYAFGGSLLLLPMLLIWWRYSAVRLLLFSLIVMSVAWLQMALTVGAGTGGHHPALMWPFPHLVIAVALAEASFRWKAAGGWLLAAAVAILMASNMLTVNQYLYQLARFGGAGSWDDAIYALSIQMPGFQAGKIFVADWGIFNPLSTLHQGKLPPAGGGVYVPVGSSFRIC